MSKTKKANVLDGAAIASDAPSGERKPEKYEIEGWTRTICEAMEILNDPKKMKLVKGEMEKKKQSIKSFDDLKNKIKEDTET